MDVVVGAGPVALCLAARLGAAGPSALVGDEEPVAAVLWRRADPTTGEGLKAALADARRVWVFADDARPRHGVWAILQRQHVERLVVVLRIGAQAPPEADLPGTRVELGPCFGAAVPLVARWSAAIASGRHVWVADPGPIRALPMADALTGLIAAADHPGARWRLVGEPARLPELADVLARKHRRPARTTRVPFAWAMRRVGLPPGETRAWLLPPELPAQTPGWTAPPTAGRMGWVEDVPAGRGARVA